MFIYIDFARGKRAITYSTVELMIMMRELMISFLHKNTKIEPEIEIPDCASAQEGLEMLHLGENEDKCFYVHYNSLCSQVDWYCFRSSMIITRYNFQCYLVIHLLKLLYNLEIGCVYIINDLN